MQRISTERAIREYFPQQSLWQVYFEAINNATDAEATSVEIHIDSDGQVQNPRFELTISDNGIGFNDAGYRRFEAIRDPKDQDHKGLGRLIYLAYFDKIHIRSIFDKDDKRFERNFIFSREGATDLKIRTVDKTEATGTTLCFTQFKKTKIAASKYIQPAEIRQQIVERFYPLFQTFKRKSREFLLSINLDTTSNQQLDLVSGGTEFTPSELPTLRKHVVSNKTFDLHDDLVIWYEIQRNSSRHGVKTIADVDGRTVPISIIKNPTIPIGNFAFFLIESKLFTGTSDNSRERLVLAGNKTVEQLRATISPEIATILNSEIPEIQSQNEQSKEQLSRRYPHLSGYIDYASVGLIDQDDAIKSAQSKFFADQRELLNADALDEESFEKALEISARSLTEYILYREQVIQRLANTPPTDREQVIHDLFAPQREVVDSGQLFEDIYRQNAWLLDDKFMTFRTLLSEQNMEAIVKAISLDSEIQNKGRPDITLIFNADPHTVESVDVVVIELKKRKVDEKEGTFAGLQLLKRARLLVDHCPNIQRMWYYGIIEMDSSIRQLLEDDGWIELFSRGTVMHKARTLTRSIDQKRVPCPFFLISFDAVVEDAAARNHTFLELLRGKIRDVGEPV